MQNVSRDDLQAFLRTSPAHITKRLLKRHVLWANAAEKNKRLSFLTKNVFRIVRDFRDNVKKMDVRLKLQIYRYVRVVVFSVMTRVSHLGGYRRFGRIG